MRKFILEHFGKLLLGSILLAIAIWAVCVYVPVKERKTVEMWAVDGKTIEAEIDITWNRRVFSEDKIKGTVVVDGVVYASEDLQAVTNAAFYAVGGDPEACIVFSHVYGKRLEYIEVIYNPMTGETPKFYYYPASSKEDALVMFMAIYGV